MKRRLFTITAMIALASILFVGCGKNQDMEENENVAGISQTEEEQIELSEEQQEIESEEPVAEEIDMEVEESDTEVEGESESKEEETSEDNAEGEEETDVKETEYGDGTYKIEVISDEGYLDFEFQDGELLHQEYGGVFDLFGGKASYGYYNSIEESPYYGMTVEELTKLIEDSGYEYNLTKE